MVRVLRFISASPSRSAVNNANAFLAAARDFERRARKGHSTIHQSDMKPQKKKAKRAPWFHPRQLGIAVAIVVLSAIAGYFASQSLYPNSDMGSEILVYSDPENVCCQEWIEYLRKNGFRPTVRIPPSIGAIHKFFGVPQSLRSCHTAIIDGYVIEGHVPVEDIRRLLKEKPDARGLSVPGMPGAAPGLQDCSPSRLPYDVILFGTAGPIRTYAKH